MNELLYLAARFSRLAEMLEVERVLNQYDFRVNSRWLRGGHEWGGVPDDDIPPADAARFARDDLDDILACQAFVCFTEPQRTTPSRGGRHVEFGYALALDIPIVIVGHRENVFYCLDSDRVAFAADVEAAIMQLILWRQRRVLR